MARCRRPVDGLYRAVIRGANIIADRIKSHYVQKLTSLP
jgi:hypothetical protein